MLKPSNPLVCPKCDRPKKEWAQVCWKCHTDEMIEGGYRRGIEEGRLSGYEMGYSAGLADGKAASVSIDARLWRQLVQLAHPDKHSGSRTAVEVTQWLQKIRP